MSRIILAALAAAVLSGAPALADKPPHAKDKDKPKARKEAAAAERESRPAAGFGDRDRTAWRDYWRDTYGRGNCPPGLAKKNNGCLPPGQAKKRYVVGGRLPADVVWRPLPDRLVPVFGPPPAGYTYGIVDGDVLKLAIGTRMVVDAITAFVD